jgi:hypothetical protein
MIDTLGCGDARAFTCPSSLHHYLNGHVDRLFNGDAS